MTNKHDPPRNSYYNEVCGAEHKDGLWICSLSEGHRSDYHKAYKQHQTSYRSQYVKQWRNYGNAKKAKPDDVAEALASIQATMQSRLPPQALAKRVDEANQALAETYQGGVTVQIHVQNDMKAELDAVIEKLTALRDSLP